MRLDVTCASLGRDRRARREARALPGANTFRGGSGARTVLRQMRSIRGGARRELKIAEATAYAVSHFPGRGLAGSEACGAR